MAVNASAIMMNRGKTAELKGRILLVDDDPTLLRTYQRVLRASGYQVDTASTGVDALATARAFDFDAILSDINMPGLDGLALLRAVKEHHLEVPVVLMTGGASLETAVTAVEFGALRYLTKPMDLSALAEVLGQAVGLRRIARAKQQMLHHLGVGPLSDLATLEARFEHALDTLTLAFQPIACWSERRLYGYEALMRCEEASLLNPMALLDAAERIGRLFEVGRTVRQRAADALAAAPHDTVLFVNIHPHDLLDEELAQPDGPLVPYAPRVVFELTERESFDAIPDVRTRIAALRQLGFRMAVDDLGAGYAGLTRFVQVEPEVVKIDMSLVRDVEKSPLKQKLIRSLASVCAQAGLMVVAEGIETEAERDMIVSLGCDLLQGYLLARPSAVFPIVKW